MNFICPNCKGTRLEEVMIKVIQTTEITDIGECGDISYNWPQQSCEDGEVESYQCADCGDQVKDEYGNTITMCDELAKRLACLERTVVL